MENNPTQTHHQHQEHHKNWYDRNYKYILVIPAILLILSLIYLVNFNNKNGDIIYKDVSLTGGTTITVFDENVNIESLTLSLKSQFPDIVARGISDIRTGKQQGFFIETKSSPEQIKPALEKYLKYNLTSDNSSVEFTGSSLSTGFYQQLRIAVLIAFLLMAITVFVIFRTPVPSGAVILCAFADIVMTVTVVNMMGIQLAVAGIVAFLMLIGYSVDTDILLTTRCIRSNEGTINHRVLSAFKTGITMTLTAIASVGVSLLIIYNFSDTLRQIFTIILIGLFFDIINTWITNASLLKWYMEAKTSK
jgi:preprotein translocase subunit SecF